MPKYNKSTFTNGIAHRLRGKDTVTLYRVYDNKFSYAQGQYWSFDKPTDRLAVKSDLALKPDWNARLYYEVAEVPVDEVEMWVGEAGIQYTESGNVLEGGASQIAIPEYEVEKDENGEIIKDENDHEIRIYVPEEYIVEKDIELGFHGNYHEFEKKAQTIEEASKLKAHVETEMEIEETIEEEEGIDW